MSSWTAAVRKAAVLLRDAIAPARCINCLREGSWHCEQCQAHWRQQELSCLVCGVFARDGRTCLGCRAESPLTGLVAAGPYASNRLRRGVHWLKFGSVRPVAEPLAWLTLAQLRYVSSLTHLQKHAVLVPVPLHADRERQRGFNQAALIAQAVSRLTSIPCCQALRRVRSTQRQTSLPLPMRETNVAGAFTADEPAKELLLEKSYIILVDDVTTSGSTLTAAGATLEVADHCQVWGLVIARG